MIGFEWDEDKRQRNIDKRGVDFRLAALIFSNPVLESDDQRNDYGERRILALGHVGDDCYLVGYTWRGNNRRIISAWKVGRHGEKRYRALLSGRA